SLAAHQPTRLAITLSVGAKARTGPADRMMASLGMTVSAYGVAWYYDNHLDGFVIDEQDRSQAAQIEADGVRVLVTQTIMGGPEDRRRLADEVLAFGRSMTLTGVIAS